MHLTFLENGLYHRKKPIGTLHAPQHAIAIINEVNHLKVETLIEVGTIERHHLAHKRHRLRNGGRRSDIENHTSCRPTAFGLQSLCCAA